MSVWCGLCLQLVSCDLSQQLLPCLHTFCLPCLQKHAQAAKLCPVKHCYSSTNLWSDAKTSGCESKTCQRKMCPLAELYQTACQHEICSQCWDEANKAENPLCPVRNCAAPLLDEEDKETCAGSCGATMDNLKLNSLPCCQAHMCSPCLDKWTEGKGRCPEGKCLPSERAKKKRKRMVPVPKTPCSGQPDCDGEVLRNFPSEQECEHSVCVSCIAKTLDECDINNSTPICPAESCRLPYRCDSVLALKALFPERAAFFNRFDLGCPQYSMDALRDETIINIAGKLTVPRPPFKLVEIRVCFCEDEENISILEFEERGSLGDLLRELRRLLKIMPWDKVHGYMRRDGETEVQLDVRQKSIQSSISSLKINKETLILVNTIGIVSSKVERSKYSLMTSVTLNPL